MYLRPDRLLSGKPLFVTLLAAAFLAGQPSPGAAQDEFMESAKEVVSCVAGESDRDACWKKVLATCDDLASDVVDTDCFEAHQGALVTYTNRVLAHFTIEFHQTSDRENIAQFSALQVKNARELTRLRCRHVIEEYELLMGYPTGPVEKNQCRFNGEARALRTLKKWIGNDYSHLFTPTADGHPMAAPQKPPPVKPEPAGEEW